MVLKISNQLEVDADEELNNTFAEYEKRIPPDVMKKVKHANKYAGGHDNKDA